MDYIEAPNDYSKAQKPHVFLAGGITGCPVWQKDMIELLKPEVFGTILNPRRENFPITDPNAAYEQIKWEHDALWQSEIISMWFSNGSVQPICMFEYGVHLTRWQISNIFTEGHLPNYLIIGADPEYQRKQDIEIQTKLVNPYIKINYTIKDQVHEISKAIDDLHQSDFRKSFIELQAKRSKK
jgi:hypothetical protein